MWKTRYKRITFLKKLPRGRNCRRATFLKKLSRKREYNGTPLQKLPRKRKYKCMISLKNQNGPKLPGRLQCKRMMAVSAQATFFC